MSGRTTIVMTGILGAGADGLALGPMGGAGRRFPGARMSRAIASEAHPRAPRRAFARQVVQLDFTSARELRAAEGADQLPAHLARRAACEPVGHDVGQLLGKARAPFV